MTSLTDDEAAALSLILSHAPIKTQDEAPAGSDSLFAAGLLRWVGGMLVITPEGCKALANYRVRHAPR